MYINTRVCGVNPLCYLMCVYVYITYSGHGGWNVCEFLSMETFHEVKTTCEVTTTTTTTTTVKYYMGETCMVLRQHPCPVHSMCTTKPSCGFSYMYRTSCQEKTAAGRGTTRPTNDCKSSSEGFLLLYTYMCVFV